MTNVSHLVHHLSFGETPKAEFLAFLPEEDKERIHPLNGKVFDVDHMHTAPHHFIKVANSLSPLFFFFLRGVLKVRIRFLFCYSSMSFHLILMLIHKLSCKLSKVFEF
jgi:hypothetical protein